MPPLPAFGQTVETGATWPDAERRAHRRVLLGASLKVESGGPLLVGTCRNISVGGLAASIEGPLAVGAKLSLVVELPEGLAIEMSGEVVRVDRGDVGVRFVALGQRALFAILSYVGNR